MNDFNNRTNNEGIINRIRPKELLSRNRSRIINDGSTILRNNGFVAKYKIDSTGSEWTTDISHTYARYKADQDYTIRSLYPTAPEAAGFGNSLNERKVLTAQSDLKLKFKKNYTLETGIKGSWLDFDSETKYFNKTAAATTPDIARTNTYIYKENINAGYLQLSKGINDIIIKAGMRLENTNMEGRQMYRKTLHSKLTVQTFSRISTSAKK